MKSLQKAVAKALLKRQQNADLKAPVTSEIPLLSNPVDSAAEQPIADITPAERVDSELTDADSWLPDEQTIAAAIELAQSRLSNRSQSSSESIQPKDAESQSQEEQAPEERSLAAHAQAELPDAYRLLLEASTDRDSQGVEEPAAPAEPGPTRNPFGPQRRRLKPVNAQGLAAQDSKSQDEQPDLKPSNSATTNAKQPSDETPQLRRSIRNWFTPGRATESTSPEDPQPPDNKR